MPERAEESLEVGWLLLATPRWALSPGAQYLLPSCEAWLRHLHPPNPRALWPLCSTLASPAHTHLSSELLLSFLSSSTVWHSVMLTFHVDGGAASSPPTELTCPLASRHVPTFYMQAPEEARAEERAPFPGLQWSSPWQQEAAAVMAAWMSSNILIGGFSPKKAEEPHGVVKGLGAAGLLAGRGKLWRGAAERETVLVDVLPWPLSCPPLVVKLPTAMFRTHLVGEVTMPPFTATASVVKN